MSRTPLNPLLAVARPLAGMEEMNNGKGNAMTQYFHIGTSAGKPFRIDEEFITQSVVTGETKNG